LTASTIPVPRESRRAAAHDAILTPVAFGLCDTCEHQQIVRNTRGSVFSLCRRSRADPTFPRYPRTPVLECRGHEPRSEADGAGEAPGGPGAGTPA
jgi:hypothetical protein